MKYAFLVIFLASIGLGACTKQELPATKKITYRVTGTQFDVTFRRADGSDETVFNQTDLFKQDVFAPVGEPMFIMARGSDDIVIKIIIDHLTDTVRKAKEVDGDLVYIEKVLNDDF
ncbi:MAG: hypothetical protein R2794_13620 [Chitinophagales bacterium]